MQAFLKKHRWTILAAGAAAAGFACLAALRPTKGERL